MRTPLHFERKYLLFTFLLFFFQLTYAQPKITSFIPAYGPVGSSITITGNNFSNNASDNIVYFGAVKANVSSATTTALTVAVPAGASYTPITVTVNGLITASSFPFTLTYSGGVVLSTTSYETKKSYTAGNFPQVIASGDLDGDGKPDIVTPNTSSNTISIFRNNAISGIISFASKQDFFTGGSPTNVSINDIDGDGKLDIIVVNYSPNTVSVYRNISTTSISFAGKIDYPIGNSSFGIAVADYDGDGKEDIAVCNSNGTSSILKNNCTIGNISFAAKIDFTIGSGSYTITAGDLDGDNKIDLVSTDNQSNTISILRNTSINNVISFAPRIVIATNNLPSTAIIADLDGDGKQDVAVGSESGNFVSIYRNLSNIGSIALATKVDYAATTSDITYNISAGDLNGDAKADIVISNYHSNSISVLENTSTPAALSFKAALNYPTDTGPYYVLVQDLDGDGINDFISANATANTIAVFRNKLNASVLPNISSFTPTTATTGSTVTINGFNFIGTSSVSFGGIAASSFTVLSATAIQAVVANGYSGEVSVTTNNGTAQLAGFTYFGIPSITSFIPQSGPVGTTVTINGNNFNPSIINNQVYFGGVKGTVLTASPTVITVTVPFGATYKPITVSDTTTKLTAYSKSPFLNTFSNGTIDVNSFATKIDFTTDVDPIDLFLADIDNDGQLDIGVANDSSNFISIFKNSSSTGNISFGSSKNYVSGWFPHKVVSADLNGDGKLDVITSSVGTDSMYIYRNNSVPGNLSLQFQASYATGLDPGYIAIQDLNADGKPDLVIANYNSRTISLFKNTSVNNNITFQNAGIFSTGNLYPRSIALGDIDGDGKPDISVACYNSTQDSLTVWRNTSTSGNITLDAKVNFSCTNAPWNISIADLDGDGKLDVAICGYVFDKASILRNTSTIGSISFAPKVDFITGRYPESIAIDDIDGDGKPDIVTGNYVGNTISILKNNSSPNVLSFAAKVDYATGINPTYIAIGDIDKDGKPDICVANLNSHTVSILRNQSGAASLTANITFTGSATRCSGDSVILNANAGAGLSYQWYINSVIINGATSSSYTAYTTGNYTVKVSNTAGAATSNTVIVTFLVIPTITSQGDTLLSSSGAPFYQWYYNNNVIAGAASNSLRVNKTGFYRVETSPDQKCWTPSIDLAILVTQGLLPDTLSVELYPNPSSGLFTVHVTLARATSVMTYVTITNPAGTIILQTNKLIFFGSEVKIPITLSPGMYFVKVYVNGNIKTLPIIVQ